MSMDAIGVWQALSVEMTVSNGERMAPEKLKPKIPSKIKSYAASTA